MLLYVICICVIFFVPFHSFLVKDPQGSTLQPTSSRTPITYQLGVRNGRSPLVTLLIGPLHPTNKNKSV
ncbi:hypothetical protein K439DRAFT_1633268, partial [Ramaria rubella]